jgi:hypothetical protein
MVVIIMFVILSDGYFLDVITYPDIVLAPMFNTNGFIVVSLIYIIARPYVFDVAMFNMNF